MIEAIMNKSLCKELSRACNLGLQWLNENRNEDNGWGPVAGIISDIPNTASATRTLWEFGYYDNARISLDWLVTNKNRNGGWGIKKGSHSNTFCTASVVSTLWLVNDMEYMNDLVKGEQWLIHNRNQDSSWGRSPNYIGSVHETCHVLKAIMKSDKYDEHIDMALTWLIQNRNKDNGWGFRFGKHSDPHLTSHVIEILLLRDKNQFEKIVETSVEWLLVNQDESGCWEYSNRFQRTEMQLHILLLCNLKIAKGATHRAIRWLLKNQKLDGGWASYIPLNRGNTINTSYTLRSLRMLMRKHGLEKCLPPT